VRGLHRGDQSGGVSVSEMRASARAVLGSRRRAAGRWRGARRRCGPLLWALV